MRTVMFAAVLALVASPALAQTLRLIGPRGQAVTLTAADLASLPSVKFTFDAHGQKHDYEGPLLIDLLAKVGAPTGKALGGKALAHVVLVTSADGYRVALGLAEADPGTRPNRIIVADRADGQPLSGNEGPFKLVIEGDLRPARAARMVTDVRVIALAESAP